MPTAMRPPPHLRPRRAARLVSVALLAGGTAFAAAPTSWSSPSGQAPHRAGEPGGWPRARIVETPESSPSAPSPPLAGAAPRKLRASCRSAGGGRAGGVASITGAPRRQRATPAAADSPPAAVTMPSSMVSANGTREFHTPASSGLREMDCAGDLIRASCRAGRRAAGATATARSAPAARRRSPRSASPAPWRWRATSSPTSAWRSAAWRRCHCAACAPRLRCAAAR